MPTGNSAQLEHAPVTYAKNEKDIKSKVIENGFVCRARQDVFFAKRESFYCSGLLRNTFLQKCAWTVYQEIC